MFLGEIFLYNPGKKKMSTKSDLQDEVDRLNAVVAQQNQTIQTQADTIIAKSREITNIGYTVENLKASNAHLARYADDLRAQAEEQGLRHVHDIMRLTDLSMRAMTDLKKAALQHTAIEVERARTDVLADCFDRTLQTLAGHTAPTQG